MDDLISRQYAIDAILADKIDAISLKVMTALGDGRLALTLNDACDRHIRAIEQLPSAEPEVIHCKDCKHYKAYEYTGKLACCYLIGSTVEKKPDDFCSMAERLEE